jgi:predicted nucleotidyltransferase
MKTKKLTDKEIIKILRKHTNILRKYGVKKIGLFGSYVRGEQKESSDIDFLVEFDASFFGRDFKGLFDAYMNLSFYLEKLFGRKVDILTPVSVNTIRIKEVAEEIRRSVVYV